MHRLLNCIIRTLTIRARSISTWKSVNTECSSTRTLDLGQGFCSQRNKRQAEYELVYPRCLAQVNRLRERAVSGGIPDGEAHPLLSGCVERDAEFVAGERAHIGERNDLAVD